MTDRTRILLAGADQKALLALAKACRLKGWDHALAGDAAHALAQARQGHPAAVVLDCRLPAGGALITLKRLRASAQTADVPVVMFGDCSPEQKAEFLAAGAAEVVADGEDGDAVCAVLERLLAAPEPVPVPAAPAEIIRNPLRLAALQASGLLDSPPDRAFDRVTRLVARLLNTPTALLSLVDKDRQFFKSQIGLADPWATARQTPLTHSFCQWVVSGREPVAVNDAREHRVLRHNGAVRDMGVIAYSGVPVSSVQGEALGSLCAIDARPRAWNDADLATLGDLARVAESGIAHATLMRQPPQSAEEFDHYVEATGGAINGVLGILRRGGNAIEGEDRELLYDLIQEYGDHLVQVNRLIQVNQLIR